MTAGDAAVGAELTQLLGRDVSAWSATPLVHNPDNAVTGDILRIARGDFTAVLKVLSADNAGHVTHWHARPEPSHWNYWRREQLVYESGLPELLSGGGLKAPKLLGSFHRSETEVALWLEDLCAPAPASWSIASLGQAAQSLGHGQGALTATGRVPDQRWLSRGFVRDYSTSKPVDWRLLGNAGAWEQPLIRAYWPASLKADMERLFAERDRWLGLLETLPRTLCHLDFWPNNLVVGDDLTTAFDWSFAGDGALGEDVGNLVPDAVFDHFLGPADLPALDDAVYTAYVRGLREGGWRGDERTVRLAMCASGVKYLFLVPLLLERAKAEKMAAYGGGADLSPELGYGVRGATLAFLAGWAQEARELAEATGWA